MGQQTQDETYFHDCAIGPVDSLFKPGQTFGSNIAVVVLEILDLQLTETQSHRCLLYSQHGQDAFRNFSYN